jgi:hypothetical protein
MCERYGKKFKNIIIIVDRLSKKKKFVALDFINVKTVIQAFIEWI